MDEALLYDDGQKKEMEARIGSLLVKMDKDERLHIGRRRDVPFTSAVGTLGCWKKPSQGVWYSTGSLSDYSWVRWCLEQEMLDWIDPDVCQYYAFKVREVPFSEGVTSEPAVARITTDDELRAFHHRYAKGPEQMDWDRIKEEGWAGVYIDLNYKFQGFWTPAERLSKSEVDKEISSWYSGGWGSSSGCIWDTRAFLGGVKPL